MPALASMWTRAAISPANGRERHSPPWCTPRGGPRSAQRNGERAQPVRDRIDLPHRWFSYQVEIGEAPHQRVDRDLSLEAGMADPSYRDREGPALSSGKRGTRARTLVPLPGALSMLSVPSRRAI